MFRAPIRTGSIVIGMTAALVVIGMMSAVIDTNEGPACATTEEVRNECRDKVIVPCYTDCKDRYDKGGMQWACLKECDEKYEICKNIEMESKKEQPPTGTKGTTVPPTKAGQNVGKVSGVNKDPVTGTGTVPKTKIGENVGKVGGVNKVGGGWNSPPTSGGNTILMHRSDSRKKH